ncbi:DUF3888 domain-containing protein [Clostridium algoriphilum]|uniref:DUF3888 domain-containing protein n=1 Tax=Clostridium algoriphilum TaxID=198347 RepID=UPI001CF106A4|nr:DUF3888 domain-containing protein [Clostridium algoriphilum]MCB2295598.1 DUF3888 domain-containing protein [Clostridium algoriphilum]
MIILKRLIIILSFFVCFTCIFCIGKSFAININKPSNDEVTKLPEDSKQKISNDVVISLLMPYIRKEVNKYYKHYLTEPPLVFPYSVDIISAKREGGVGYLIKLELIVHPFVGAINTIGDDRIIIKTGAFGSVQIIKFKHIKSYKLPWNYQYLIKKAY